MGIVGHNQLQGVVFDKDPMLKSCPRFLRGRLRECFSFVERDRGVRATSRQS